MELFADGNGDGVGDFPGPTDKINYLAGLGDQHHEPAEAGKPLALDGFGYRWLRPPG